MDPRHPPSALTSLTTRTVALSTTHLKLTMCSLESLRQVAKSSHTSLNRRRNTRVVHCDEYLPYMTLVFVFLSADALFVCRRDFASSTIISICIFCLTSSSLLKYLTAFLASSFVLRTSFNYLIIKASKPAGVGQERFELSTPRLSSVCSNQLSYWPVG